MSALTAFSRKGLELMFRIAKEQRPYVPMGQMTRGVRILLRDPAFTAGVHEYAEVVPAMR